MKITSKELKSHLESLSQSELISLILKAISKSKEFSDYLYVTVIAKETGEEELYNQAKAELNLLMHKRYKGFSETLQYANMFAACHKRVNDFGKVCKNKVFEMDLLMYLLEIAFSEFRPHFGTCFNQFDTKIFIILKKAVSLLKTKLHEDYHIQYAPRLNTYLTQLHSTSNHLDYIYEFYTAV